MLEQDDLRELETSNEPMEAWTLEDFADLVHPIDD